MVVTGAPLATAVGVHVLEEGGNAIDAAAAIAFALGVVEPSQSGIGGRTQILLRRADGRLAAIDGTTEVPTAYLGGPTDDEDAYGWSTIAVPGTVAALAQAVGEHGTWPLARVLQPAIALAEDGFTLSAGEARRIAGARERVLEFEGSRSLFLRRDGMAYGEGDLFRQPVLARTLRAIADSGEEVFYRGRIAREMVADIAAHGGLVTEADVAAYRAVAPIIVRGAYRGRELIGTYLPASGATTIEILQILDAIEPAASPGSAAWVSHLTQALLAAFEDREADVMPAAAKAEWLVSRELARERAAQIAARIAVNGPAVSDPAASNPAVIRPPGTSPSPRNQTRSSNPFDREPAHTTHVSVADRDGNVVALTQSVGPNMGSKVASPELGFLYAATMGYLGELEPDTRRHWSSQSPLIVLRDGRPEYVIGGAGARRILSAVVETLARAIAQELPLDAALAAPRFHPTPARIDAEAREGAAWGEDVLGALRAMGHTVNARDDASYFGRINAIHRADGLYTGVSDPRWQGVAGAPAR